MRDAKLVVIDQNTVFVYNQMLEVGNGRNYLVPTSLLGRIETIHLSIVILDQTVTIEMMIIEIETTGKKVGALIMIGTDTIVTIMMVMIIGMDMTEMSTTIENHDVAIVICPRFYTMTGTIRPMETGVVVQVDDMNMMSGTGRHDIAVATMNQMMKVVEENGSEAKITVVAERKRRGVIVVAARDHLAAHLSKV